MASGSKRLLNKSAELMARSKLMISDSNAAVGRQRKRMRMKLVKTLKVEYRWRTPFWPILA